MNEKEFKRLIDGYIDGTLSKAELELFQKWYDSFGESETDIPLLDNELSTLKLKAELNERIQRFVEDDEKVRHLPVQKTKPKWLYIAASLSALVLTASLLFIKYEDNRTVNSNANVAVTYQEIKTGTKQIKKLLLTDGSTIHLNANSVVRVPVEMKGKKREIFLQEGEAFFEVSKDPSRPFIVHGKAVKVSVLGTAFNLKSYQSLKDVFVSVEHGKVRVTNEAGVLADLVKNEQLVYNRSTGHSEKSQANSLKIKAWTSGEVYLEKAGFEELALALHNLHNIRLYSNDPKIKDNHYNLKLQSSQSLEEVMEVICSIHNNKYRRGDHEIMLY